MYIIHLYKTILYTETILNSFWRKHLSVFILLLYIRYRDGRLISICTKDDSLRMLTPFFLK